MMRLPEKFIYSLPVQLIFHHVKRNLPLMAMWLFVVGAAYGKVGKVYGIHYLFLDPEYLNHVGFWSFFFVGLTWANFTLAFFITSYILDSHRFSFVAILERPFLKFSINNSIIPLIALIAYLIKMVHFQLNNEFTTIGEVIIYVLGFLTGHFGLLFFIYFYFLVTNKDIFKYLTGSVDKRLRKSKISRDRMMNKWKESTENKYPVAHYFDLRLRMRDCKHLHNFYDRQAILKVFDQNHLNSVILELVIIVLILVLGIFMDFQYFQIPAAASCLMLGSIVVMMVGAITYWFKGWGIAFFVALFLISNELVQSGIFRNINEASGLDYSTKAVYSLDNLRRVQDPAQIEDEKEIMLGVLEKWKQKNTYTHKPKIIFQCVSGGGQRAALWTLNGMQKADSVLNGTLMDKVFMTTGASGGMVGAAYFRELYRQKSEGKGIDLYSDKWVENMGRDNLNPIIFSLVVNDSFFKFQSYDYAGIRYSKDRGYAFERSLNKNLENALDLPIKTYRDYELNADIPILLLSPTIANDGRKLYISTLPITFMNMSIYPDGLSKNKIRGVDFMQFFDEQNAENLSMLTALRMSASFPYITPTISLPSEPRLEIMDAGISDNFGISDALRFLYVFKDWIEENTSEIVLLVIRDTKKIEPVQPRPNSSIIDRFTYPISSVYNNLANIQDISNDKQVEMARIWINLPITTIELEYDSFANQKKGQDRASLSWHLTSKEKKNILDNINLDHNMQSLRRLKSIFQTRAITDSNP